MLTILFNDYSFLNLSSVYFWVKKSSSFRFNLLKIYPNETYKFELVEPTFKTEYFICELNYLNINESCMSTTECLTSRYLSCINGKCQCDSTMYWNGSYCGRVTN